MSERMQRVDKELFQHHLPELVDKFAETMRATPPYNLEISKENTLARFLRESQHPGFGAIFVQINGEIVGVSTFRQLPIEEIRKSDDLVYPEVLSSYLEALQVEYSIGNFVRIDRTFVVSAYQRGKRATPLRSAVIDRIRDKNPDGAIIFTNHVDSNTAIIKSSKALVFLKGLPSMRRKVE